MRPAHLEDVFVTRRRRPVSATASLLGVLLLGAAACEASVDGDGAEVDIDQDALDADS
jgi:hypothetical protein